MIKSRSLLEGGTLMPIGDYKGFNIALVIEMLTTTFSDENDVNPFIALVIKANTSVRKSLERLPRDYHLLNKKRKEEIEIPENLRISLTRL